MFYFFSILGTPGHNAGYPIYIIFFIIFFFKQILYFITHFIIYYPFATFVFNNKKGHSRGGHDKQSYSPTLYPASGSKEWPVRSSFYFRNLDTSSATHV